MKIFAISDTHFNHAMLVEKGYRPADFIEQICTNLERASGDLLIHCGDFAIGGDEVAMQAFKLASRNFKKRILVRGNHDGKSDAWYVDRGFDFVCDGFVNKYFGKTVLFTHIPRERTEGFDHNIHGHLHGNQHRLEGALAEMYEPGYHIDLAPEIRNYGPVDISKLI